MKLVKMYNQRMKLRDMKLSYSELWALSHIQRKRTSNRRSLIVKIEELLSISRM